MSNPIEARRRLREIGAAAEETIKNKSLSDDAKMKKLNDLTLEMEPYTAILDTHNAAQKMSSGANDKDFGGITSSFSGQAKKGLKVPGTAVEPTSMEVLFKSAQAGQNLNIELKDAASSDATRGQLPAAFGGVVQRLFEPTRILAHIPTTGLNAPSITFITHTTDTVGIGAPVITLGTTAAGGTFAAGTYFWKLSAINAGGETLPSNEITATLTANQKQTVNWTAITGATGYRLYRGTAAGQENILVAEVPGQTTATYTDLGTAGSNAALPAIDRTAIATTVPPGGLYPVVSLNTTSTTLTARKFGIYTVVIDELLEDFPQFADYVQDELSRKITDAENWQLLQGDGTGQNLLGLLRVPNTLSRAKVSTDLPIDTLEQGIQDLRVGPSYAEPDVIIINPSTWSTIRRSKATGTGNYLLGNPGDSPVNDVWGIPVVETTQMPVGTVIVANLAAAATAYVIHGVRVQMTNSADDDFENGRVKIRADERLALGVQRPTAINVLTGF